VAASRPSPALRLRTSSRRRHPEAAVGASSVTFSAFAPVASSPPRPGPSNSPAPACNSATPPPATMPSSTAAHALRTASSMRCLRSSIDHRGGEAAGGHGQAGRPSMEIVEEARRRDVRVLELGLHALGVGDEVEPLACPPPAMFRRQEPRGSGRGHAAPARNRRDVRAASSTGHRSRGRPSRHRAGLCHPARHLDRASPDPQYSDRIVQLLPDPPGQAGAAHHPSFGERSPCEVRPRPGGQDVHLGDRRLPAQCDLHP
jgi:hypothetical protein